MKILLPVLLLFLQAVNCYNQIETALVSNDYRKICRLLANLSPEARIDPNLIYEIALIPKLDSLRAILEAQNTHPALQWQKDGCSVYRNAHITAMEIFHQNAAFKSANCSAYYILELLEHGVNPKFITNVLVEHHLLGILELPNVLLEKEMQNVNVDGELQIKYFELSYIE